MGLDWSKYWQILLTYEETIDWGRITLYVALGMTVFVAIKAMYEIYMHSTSDFRCDLEEKKNQHRRAHIVGLLGIMTVCMMQIVGYVWFDLKNVGMGDDDRTIGVFNILFINLYMLFNINHFKAERSGTTEKGTWKELFKF